MVSKLRKNVVHVAVNAENTRSELLSAIDHFGSQSALAKAVGLKQPSISGAVLRGRASARLAQLIHKATRGKHPRWKLRPDLYSAAD